MIRALAFLLFTTTLFAASPAEFVYRTVGARELKAYVFAPAPSGQKHRPAILVFHGGAWNLGDATWVFDRAKDFAAHGLVAIAIDYRLAAGGVAPLPINAGLTPVDSVEDACAAFEWARRNATRLGIDPHRIAGYGDSAGGHLVAAAATLPAIRGKAIPKTARPNALVLFSPALNMAKDEYFVSLIAGKDNPALYSPSEFITHALPPTLIVQGEEDAIVKAGDARAFCALAAAGHVRCELHMYPGVGHLLTRNLKIQYANFDADPHSVAEAVGFEYAFLRSLGYSN